MQNLVFSLGPSVGTGWSLQPVGLHLSIQQQSFLLLPVSSALARLMLKAELPTMPLVVAVESLSHVHPCNTLNCSTPGFPVLHYLPEFVQTHVL